MVFRTERLIRIYISMITNALNVYEDVINYLEISSDSRTHIID
jgi:hypothetical protein